MNRVHLLTYSFIGRHLANDYSDELSRLIQIQTELAILKINDQLTLTATEKEIKIYLTNKNSDALFKKVNEFRETCIQNYSQKSKESEKKLINEVKSFIERQNIHLNEKNINAQSNFGFKYELSNLKKKLEQEFENSHESMFDGRIMKFEPYDFQTWKIEYVGCLKFEKIVFEKKVNTLIMI